MKIILAFIISLFVLQSPASASETRCGWIENSMPSLLTITDNNRTWTISNFSYMAEGFADHMPDVNTHMACGCLKVTTDKVTSRITNVLSGYLISNKRCEADKSIKPLS